jgi:NAD(P)-dependent dehydrogenase (short-subunit alcohol dehydrogenase family)
MLKSSPLFSRQIVWITGASSGIGRELALAFARQGAKVAVSARRNDLLAELVAEIRSSGGEAESFPLDVTDAAKIQHTVQKVVARFGKLDVAVANAGFAVMGKVESLSAEEWKRQLDVNVVGLALTARYALPQLKKTAGRLALMGSIAAFVPAGSLGAYSTSKAAVRILGQTLSIELAGSGVSCTTLHPGFIESNITAIDNEGRFDPDRKDPRPKELLWKTDRAARVMLKAIYRRKRQYVFTGHGKVISFIGQHWPALIHHASVRGFLPSLE